MKRAPALLLLALLSAAPFAARAQTHNGMRASPPRGPGTSLRGPSNRVHTPTQLKTPQPAAAGPADQQCIQGQCANAVQRSNGALIIPVRSSSDLVHGGGAGAIPATSITSQPGGMIEPGPGVRMPAPRQPLSDVLAQPGTVRITIRAISALRQGQGLEIDGRLAPIDRDLRSFADQFSYRNYRLLDVQTFDLDFRSIAQMELPGRRAIEVEPRQLGPDGRVKVHLELLGQHPDHQARMRTDYSIPRGRTILVGGYKIDPSALDSGTLLLAITQDE